MLFALLPLSSIWNSVLVTVGLLFHRYSGIWNMKEWRLKWRLNDVTVWWRGKQHNIQSTFISYKQPTNQQPINQPIDRSAVQYNTTVARFNHQSSTVTVASTVSIFWKEVIEMPKLKYVYLQSLFIAPRRHKKTQDTRQLKAQVSSSLLIL